MELGKLLALLQGARDGSEYLDYAIQRALFPMAKPAPQYTRSLDAAMRLLPPDWTIHRLSNMSDCRGGLAGWLADLFRPTDVVIPFPCEAAAQTAPLALAIAALRVRVGLRLQCETPARRSARS